MTEREFQSQVVALARILGWRVHHTRPARTASGWRTPIQGDAGWPDLVLLRGSRLVVAELKVGRNRPTAEQAAWLEALNKAIAEVYLWTPLDWDEIERLLR